MEVLLTCDCKEHEKFEECTRCITELNKTSSGTNGALFVATTSSVTLSLDQQLDLGGSSNAPILALFIPPSVWDAVDFVAKAAPATCQSKCWFLDEAIRTQIAVNILPSIHPFLSEHGMIMGILSLCHGHNCTASADILLLDVSMAPSHWTNDILAALNGESIASHQDMVLKIIPIETLIFTTNFTMHSASSATSHLEIPTCPVCLHRINPLRLGLPRPQNHQLCSEYCDALGGTDEGCRNQRFLRPWPLPSYCSACHVIHNHWNALRLERTPDYFEEGMTFTGSGCDSGDLFCNRCAMQETLWVCLTCSFVGCGRYSHGHAVEHYQESGHSYSLELATLRIWDYANSEFVQRGDLLECPSMRRFNPFGSLSARKRFDRALASPNNYESTDCQYAFSFDDSSPKKATMIGEEYEALLQSALEDQAQHYEGEITRLRAALTAEFVDEGTMTKEEAEEIESLKTDITRFRTDIDRLGRQLLDAQAQEAGHRAASQRLLREQAVAKDLLDKIREEAEREHEQGKVQVEELEQQVADLTANLRMRHQFSQDEELSNAQIFGTTSSTSKSTKRGKKIRRSFRK